MVNLEILEHQINVIIFVIFFIGIISALYLLKLKRTSTNLFLVLLNVGGFFLSFGAFLNDILVWEDATDFISAFIIFFSSILLVLGIVVNLEEKLTYSEEKFQYIFENSPYAILLINPEGYIIKCNSSATLLFKKKKEFFIGKALSDLPFFPQDIKERVKKVLENNSISDSKDPITFSIISSDLPETWIDLKILKHQYHDEVFLQAILRDITEDKRVELIKKQELEKIKELEGIRSDLIRRMSHELKTPLNSIISTSDYIIKKERSKINDEILKFIKIINRGGKRLNNLTNNLMDIFNIESNKLVLKKESTDIIELITNCVNDLIISIQERQLTLKFAIEGKYFIDIDKNRIEQVILNILTNAIKNTPPNGLIYIDFKDFSDHIEIIIKDTGVGFLKEEQEKVFKKFGKIERKDVDRDIITEGSGLGLFVSKEIIERHEGKIILESEGRNQGSTFRIILPKNKS